MREETLIDTAKTLIDGIGLSKLVVFRCPKVCTVKAKIIQRSRPEADGGPQVTLFRANAKFS